LAAWEAGAAYCRDAVAKARDRNDESLIGLIAGALGDGIIDDSEVLAMMMVLLTGGMTTMIAATSSALYWLARHPALKQRVRDEPELATAALDEAMRIFPPITFSMRFATRDAEINGKLIPAGAPVYVMWAGANQDPATFPDPDRYDLDRPNVRAHVAFGFGVHNCIGNHVTRQVGTTLIRAMLDRYPDFALARPNDEPEFLLADRDPEALKRAATELRAGGHEVTVATCDVTDAAAVGALAAAATGQGPVRALAHVVGLSPSMGDWRTIMSVDLVDAVLVEEAMVDVAGRGTAAVFISSTAAHGAPPDAAVGAIVDDPLADDFLDRLAAAIGDDFDSRAAYRLAKWALNRRCRRRGSPLGRAWRSDRQHLTGTSRDTDGRSRVPEPAHEVGNARADAPGPRGGPCSRSPTPSSS
jgi:NAD(P)-dependent dehydrogenase (short-subunit alcohol dehydrogenase family)